MVQTGRQMDCFFNPGGESKSQIPALNLIFNIAEEPIIFNTNNKGQYQPTDSLINRNAYKSKEPETIFLVRSSCSI